MIQPSLQIGGGDWAVKETKLLGTNPLLNEKLPVEIDVTNATIGTRVNEQGIIENGPRNLLTFSETFDNAVWQKQGSTATIPIVTANSIIAPNGTLTAELVEYSLVPDGDFCALTANVTNVSESTTVSIYAKAFDLSQVGKKISIIGNGTLGVSGSVGTLTLDWQRFTYIKPGKNNQIIIGKGRSTYLSGGITNAEMATKFYIWGAQLEEGSTATEYYPTTTRTNLARIDYSSGKAALLIEPRRTNLATYSEDFDNSQWIKNAGVSIVPNVDISPSNILTADKLIGANNIAWGGGSILQRSFSVSSSTNYTLSVYVKSADVATLFSLSIRDNNVGGQQTSSFLINNTNWIKVSLNYTTSSTQSLIGIIMGNTNGDVLIWGAQLEVGAYDTSYIPTLASAVTRNVDIFTKNNIYTDKLLTNAGGTWLIKLDNNLARVRDTFANGIQLIDNGGTNSIVLTFGGQTSPLEIFVRKTQNGTSTVLTNLNGETVNCVIKWNGVILDIFLNGIKIVSGSSFTTLDLNNFNVTGTDVTKRIQSMLLFPIPLTDAQCVALTTI
jgi:hypothetical protein